MTSFVFPQASTPPPLSQDFGHPLLSGALRRGKWTPEEEAYAAAIIQYFLSGVLPIQYGTTLRGYIAQLLHCDPMRVSKKLIPGSVLVGVRIDPKIGRRSYYPCAEGTPGLETHRQAALERLAQFRALFIESIEREELQERATTARALSSSGLADLRRLSPLRHNADHHQQRHDHQQDSDAAAALAISLRPLANESTADPDADDASMARPPSLPSLNDLLRQNRLRVPSKTLTPPHGGSHTLDTHPFLQASVFHDASPVHGGTPATTTPSPPP